ncbi:hypothetical protein RSSM_06815 [Rhodopirellula sallentina SM41]|uniref:NHL repeat containing protein n=2 Tax=Rhodopirellula TaxID=265488 RepID=M5TRD2_9BACT|nr:hypothetical protein RSSM_06815 [Rhodopirellula sallentina SM41]
MILGGVSAVVIKMESLTDPGRSFAFDVSRQLKIDDSLLHYTESEPIALPVTDSHSFAVAPDGNIVLCGETSVTILDDAGGLLWELPLPSRPRCVVVAGQQHVHEGRIYVGCENTVEVFAADGMPVDSWSIDAKYPLLTAIAASNDRVYVADAGNQTVMVFDASGNRVEDIGSGFVVPSEYFDLSAEPNGLIHIVNPGARRIETYTADRKKESEWGQAGANIEDFFGCCNPVHIAVLPGGRFVTSEKGIARIKIYDDRGNMQCLVAGTQQLMQRHSTQTDGIQNELVLVADVFDIDVDPLGNVLVLDQARDEIRKFVLVENKVFVENKENEQ